MAEKHRGDLIHRKLPNLLTKAFLLLSFTIIVYRHSLGLFFLLLLLLLFVVFLYIIKDRLAVIFLERADKWPFVCTFEIINNFK